MFGFGNLTATLSAIAIAATLGWALLIHGPSQKQAGIAEERARTFAAIERQRDERNTINETVRNLDDADLCRDLGGLFVNGQCQ